MSSNRWQSGEKVFRDLCVINTGSFLGAAGSFLNNKFPESDVSNLTQLYPTKSCRSETMASIQKMVVQSESSRSGCVLPEKIHQILRPVTGCGETK